MINAITTTTTTTSTTELLNSIFLSTIRKETTKTSVSISNNFILIENWRYYLVLLNILAIVSFICDCFLIIFLIFNLIRKNFCCFLKRKSKLNSIKYKKPDEQNIQNYRLNNDLASTSTTRPCSTIVHASCKNNNSALNITKENTMKNALINSSYIIPTSKQTTNTDTSSNYVTIAFISHQAMIDLLRIIYCILYINNLKFQSQTQHKYYMLNVLLNNTYNKYCFQIATFYSVLTMVTLINTLTIFICETCRFYDLKLNSNDTSNMCCVIFGVMLIWLSSLIIISSIMLIGIASSAAPFNCNVESTLLESQQQFPQQQHSNNSFLIGQQQQKQDDLQSIQMQSQQQLLLTTTATRTFVINCIWLFIVCLIICVAIFYSRSLYKELNSLDYRHHRISIYALYSPLRNPKATVNWRQRHFFIVKQTSKRLIILFILILIFCLTWFPNFIFIILNVFLKNVYSNSHVFRVATLLTTILWLLNPCFNSFVFLSLFIKEYSSSINFMAIKNKILGQNSDNNDHDENDVNENNFKKCFSNFRHYLCAWRSQGSVEFEAAASFDTPIEMQSNFSLNNRKIIEKKLDFKELQTKIGNRLGDAKDESDLFL